MYLKMLIGSNLPKVGLLMSITLIGGGAAIMYFEQGQDSFKNFFPPSGGYW